MQWLPLGSVAALSKGNFMGETVVIQTVESVDSVGGGPLISFEGLIPSATSLTPTWQKAPTSRFGLEHELIEGERTTPAQRYIIPDRRQLGPAYGVERSEPGIAQQHPVHESVFLLQVETEVSHRLQQLPWWQKPFAEQIKPFMRARAKEELRTRACGVLSASSFAAEAARIVGDESYQNGVAASGTEDKHPRQLETPILPESSGAAAVAKAALREYIKKGSGVTSLAAAGLMFIPGGQLAGGALIAVHSAAKLKTTIHDAGVRAQEHVAQAQIRLQASGSAGENMDMFTRIHHNLARAGQLPASTIKEFGAKALAYAGAVLSPLGQEHQIARAAAKGFSRMVSADELLASQENVLEMADVPTLVALSERIGQSLARGYVRNMQRAGELQAYKERLDTCAHQRAGNASEVLAARHTQGEAIAAELDELARADAKWAVRHELKHKLAYGALSSIAAVRMMVEATIVAQSAATLIGVDLPGAHATAHTAVHAAAEAGNTHADISQQLMDQRYKGELAAPAKGAPLIDKGILPGHDQDFAVDTTPDGRSIRFYSLDGSGNGIELKADGHTYILPFNNRGQLVLGRNGTVNAVTSDGSVVQLRQEDVLKYLGIDQHVQNGLQQNGGVLEASGYQIRRLSEVQFDSHTGTYHTLASTAGDPGGTFEAHTDTLAAQPITNQHIGGNTPQHGPSVDQSTPNTPSAQTPTPTPVPTEAPTPVPVKTAVPTPTPLTSVPQSPATFSHPNTVPDTHTVDENRNALPFEVVGAVTLITLGGLAYFSYQRWQRHQRINNRTAGLPSPAVSPQPNPQNRTQSNITGPSIISSPNLPPLTFTPITPTTQSAQSSVPGSLRPNRLNPVSASASHALPPHTAISDPNLGPYARSLLSQQPNSLHPITGRPLSVPQPQGIETQGSFGAHVFVELGIPETFTMRHAENERGEPVLVSAVNYRPDVLDKIQTPLYSIGWASDRGDGPRNKANEDTVKVITRQDFTLALVADGMGGHSNGKAASELVGEEVAASFERHWLDNGSSLPTQSVVQEMLKKAIKEANQKLFNKNLQTSSGKWKARSGSTLTVVVMPIDGSYVVGNVGDTRGYFVDHSHAERITKDHSRAEEEVDAGNLKREEVYTYFQNNVITRNMGATPDVNVDIFGGKLELGQKLVLAGDGIWEMIREPDGSVTNARNFHAIAASTPSAEEVARRMVVAALYGDGKTYGGNDNATALVIMRN